MHKLNVTVWHFKDALSDWVYTHGSSALNERTIALAFYFYMQDVYGVESELFKNMTYKQSLLTETIALDISKTDAMKRVFQLQPFPPGVSYLSGLDVNLQLGAIKMYLR